MNPTGPIPAPTGPSRTTPWLPGSMAVLWALPGLALLAYTVFVLHPFTPEVDEYGYVNGEGQFAALVAAVFAAAVALPALALAALWTTATVRLRRGLPDVDQFVFALGIINGGWALAVAFWTTWWPYHGYIQAFLTAAGLLGAVAGVVARPVKATTAPVAAH